MIFDIDEFIENPIAFKAEDFRSRRHPLFDIIYIDMPWKYDLYDEVTGGGRAASQHYDTSMPIEYFYDLPIVELTSQNSFLLLWGTYPHLLEIDPLVQAWNSKAKYEYEKFTYRTILHTWVKLNENWKDTVRNLFKNGITDPLLEEMVIRIFANGLGKYSMANPEIIAVYARGSMKNGVERIDRGVRNLQAYGILEHSKKPDQFNKLINQAFPKAKCLELFARRHYQDDRWTCLGGELSGNDIYDDIENLLRTTECQITEPF